MDSVNLFGSYSKMILCVLSPELVDKTTLKALATTKEGELGSSEPKSTPENSENKYGRALHSIRIC
jgi:hypothetical protein